MTRRRCDNPHVFVYRLMAGIAAGIAALLFGWDLYFCVFRVPAYRMVFADFDTRLPAVTEVYLKITWLPTLVAGGALAFACAAMISPRRRWLVAAWALVLFGMLTAMIGRVVLEEPMRHLMQRVQD